MPALRLLALDEGELVADKAASIKVNDFKVNEQIIFQSKPTGDSAWLFAAAHHGHTQHTGNMFTAN
jgi:hypothetical protein